jgi:hypothetical protein
MKWQKAGWMNASILQIRVIELGKKATISFHQDKLQDAAQRAEMQLFWAAALDKLAAMLS